MRVSLWKQVIVGKFGEEVGDGSQGLFEMDMGWGCGRKLEKVRPM